MDVYVSYAEADREAIRELCTHLAPLEQNGGFRIWHSGLLFAGEDASSVSAERFMAATVIVILVSADYLADPQCLAETERAVERAKRGEVRIVPVLVRKCLTDATSLASFRFLPKSGQPVMAYQERADVWSEIASALREIPERRPARSGASAAPVALDSMIEASSKTGFVTLALIDLLVALGLWLITFGARKILLGQDLEASTRIALVALLTTVSVVGTLRPLLTLADSKIRAHLLGRLAILLLAVCGLVGLLALTGLAYGGGRQSNTDGIFLLVVGVLLLGSSYCMRRKARRMEQN